MIAARGRHALQLSAIRPALWAYLPHASTWIRLPRLLLWAAALVCGDAVALPLSIPASTPAAQALSTELAAYWIAAKLLALATPLLLLVSGRGATLSARCMRLAGGRRTLAVALFAGGFAALTAVVSLPLDYARHYVLPHALGWSHSSVAAWLVEQFIQAAVLVIVAAALTWIPYANLRRSPERWWVWSTVALAPMVLFALVVKPIWVDPLTSSYKPLADASLASEIEQIAARCGVRDIAIVVGGSDTSVVGLGPTSRIVLQDGLTELESPAQIRFTIGHELKHFVMGDNWKALALICALLLGGFWSTHRFGRRAVSRWHGQFGFDRLCDPASLPLLVFCFPLLGLLATPAFLAFSRHIELEADQFSLEVTHENDAAASMFASWITPSDTLADPGWFEQTFMSNHPSLGDRIRNAQTHRSWANATSAKFDGKCITLDHSATARQ